MSPARLKLLSYRELPHCALMDVGGKPPAPHHAFFFLSLSFAHSQRLGLAFRGFGPEPQSGRPAYADGTTCTPQGRLSAPACRVQRAGCWLGAFSHQLPISSGLMARLGVAPSVWNFSHFTHHHSHHSSDQSQHAGRWVAGTPPSLSLRLYCSIPRPGTIFVIRNL